MHKRINDINVAAGTAGGLSVCLAAGRVLPGADESPFSI